MTSRYGSIRRMAGGLVALVWLLAGCGAAGPGTSSITSSSISSIPTDTPAPALSGDALKTQGAIHEATAQVERATQTALAPFITPTITNTPQPTSTISPIQQILPTPYDGPLPEGVVAQLGRGAIYAQSLSPDRQFLLMSTNQGYVMYRTTSLQPVWTASSDGRLFWLIDGKTIALGNKLYDIASGEVLRAVPISDIEEWSPDGSLFMTSSGDGTITIRDGITGSLRLQIPLLAEAIPGNVKWIIEAAFSPDGQMLAFRYKWTGGDYGMNDTWVFVVDTQTGELLYRFRYSAMYYTVSVLSWSSDSSHLFMWDWFGSGDMLIWELRTGELILTTTETHHFSWSPTKDRFVTVGNEQVTVWDASTFTPLHVFEYPEELHDAAWSLAGDTIATTSASSTQFWDVVAGKLLGEIVDMTEMVGFGPTSDVFVTNATYEHKVAIWDISDIVDPKLLHVLRGTAFVNTVAWSPDGRKLLSGGGVDTNSFEWIVWDVIKNQALQMTYGTWTSHTFVSKTSDIRDVSWSPDGRTFATGFREGNVGVWDAQSGRLLRQFSNVGTQIEFGPDGSLLATGGAMFQDNPQGITIYDSGGNRYLQKPLIPNSGYVVDMAWSPGGAKLAAVVVPTLDQCITAYPSTIQVWDTKTGEFWYTLDGLENDGLSIAWSPDGTKLAAGTRRRVTVWDVSQGKPDKEPFILYTNVESDDPEHGVLSLAWSPDSKVLAGVYGGLTWWRDCEGIAFTGPDSGQVILWDIHTGERIRRITDHVNQAQDASFSPDGNLLAVALFNGTVLIWDMSE